MYSTWRIEAKPPSNDCATRLPDPEMTRARALPDAHPGRSTTSWSTALRSGVRWSTPATNRFVHGGGDHATEAAVRGRLERLNLTVVKGAALSAGSALTVRFVATELV